MFLLFLSSCLICVMSCVWDHNSHSAACKAGQKSGQCVPLKKINRKYRNNQGSASLPELTDKHIGAITGAIATEKHQNKKAGQKAGQRSSRLQSHVTSHKAI